MTFSNYNFNLNPFANPFNTRLGPANYSLNPYGQGFKFSSINSNRTDLPDPVMYNQKNQDKLEPPETAAPMTFGTIQNLIDCYSRDKTWSHNETYYDMAQYLSRNYQGLSRKDLEWYEIVNNGNKQLSANMSDEQKKMLADLENAGFFDGQLVEESLNGQK